MKSRKNKKSEIKIEKLKDLITYQTDSIVSRTIISKKTGTITLFAFDRGQGLSEHTAPFEAMIYVLEGKVEIVISGVSYNLKKGETIIIPPNSPHSLRAIERFKMLLVMIKS